MPCSSRQAFRAVTDTNLAGCCQHARVSARWAWWTATSVIAIEAVLVVAGLVSDRLLVRAGHGELVSFDGASWVLLLGVASSAMVGLAVVHSQPRHPVGWLFLALSATILASAPLEAWIEWGRLARPGSLPATGAVAAVNDATWIPWFVLVALILLLTPTGTHLSPRWRALARTVVVAGAVAFLLSLVKTDPFEPPFQDIENPWAVPAIQPQATWIGYGLVLLVAAGLMASGVSLLVRWRRADGDDRRRLLWLALVVVPLPAFVVTAFVASSAGSLVGTVAATGGFVVLIPIAAGLSITRYHLYDVERVVARATTYVGLTVLLIGTYALIVWFGARGAQRWSTSPTIAATVGALAAAAVAAPAQRVIQDLIDRRFNRRRYDAVRLIGAELADERAGRDLTALFRQAFDDPSVLVAYPGVRQETWVTDTGSPSPDLVYWVDVVRQGRVVARIGFDPARTNAEVVGAGARIAASELDNAGLRAELARRLTDVESSRRRLADAQRTERRRIERDLHDGAQQGLLALAMELRSAQLSGNDDRMRQALSDGATAAQSAVRELRDLANGLHPAALADGGLRAALDDLAQHSPGDVHLHVNVPHLDPALEFTAWLVIAESVVNAQKHAYATAVTIAVQQQDCRLRIQICDDGGGGANPDGPGLRGMGDRVEAAGGTLLIDSPPGGGTRIEAWLPCAS
jgi:signal transduction histidine kinase